MWEIDENLYGQGFGGHSDADDQVTQYVKYSTKEDLERQIVQFKKDFATNADAADFDKIWLYEYVPGDDADEGKIRVTWVMERKGRVYDDFLYEMTGKQKIWRTMSEISNGFGYLVWEVRLATGPYEKKSYLTDARDNSQLYVTATHFFTKEAAEKELNDSTYALDSDVEVIPTKSTWQQNAETDVYRHDCVDEGCYNFNYPPE